MCKAGHPGAGSHERRARPWPVSPFYGCRAVLGRCSLPPPSRKEDEPPPHLTSPFRGGAAAPSPPPPGSWRSHAASLP